MASTTGTAEVIQKVLALHWLRRTLMKHSALPEPRVNTPYYDVLHRNIVTKLDMNECTEGWLFEEVVPTNTLLRVEWHHIV